ncbi:MAG: four helix bundle protein [Opitutaceae bacterium]
MASASYDLEERTTVFANLVIELCLEVRETAVTRPLISQLVRSGTSIGANYCEADDAESKPDFRHKIALCRKESREAKYWCRLLAQAVPEKKAPLRSLWTEANELNLIFSTIFRKSTPVK